jgi:hypothetical protein
MVCKLNQWGCVYHACMSNDCQKRYMKRPDLGKGKCKDKINKKVIIKNNKNKNE